VRIYFEVLLWDDVDNLPGIYKITNKINEKSYIGQSKHIKRRWREHVNGLENSVISTAIKKYGKENFIFEVLEQCSIKELNNKEIYYIDKFKTYGEGYNMTTGGDGVKGVGKVLTSNNIHEIIFDLRSGTPASEIADKFRVTVEMISRINNGTAWFIEGETYPIRDSLSVRIRQEMNKENLLETVATLGFKGAGHVYGMTGNGVKARCRMLGLPTRIKDIKELYGVSATLIEARYNGELLEIETVEGLVEYILANKLTTTNRKHVESSVRRALNGERKSYLGITTKIKHTT